MAKRLAPTVELTPNLNVADLHRLGALENHVVELPFIGFKCPWIKALKACASGIELTLQDNRQQVVRIVWRSYPFGGQSPLFGCPRCQRRTKRLFYVNDAIACQYCHGLRYACQRSREPYRSLFLAARLRAQLGGRPTVADPFPQRPHGMTKKKYRRVQQHVTKLEGSTRRNAKAKRTMQDYNVALWSNERLSPYTLTARWLRAQQQQQQR